MGRDAKAYWDDRYSTEGDIWGVEPNVFVIEHLSDLSPRRILDLACGQGRNAVWLANQGHDVTGIDVSSVAIEQANRLAMSAGVKCQFETADLTTWDPGSRRWDLVLLSYLQLSEDERQAVHGAAVDALVPGGQVFLIAHHLHNLAHGIGGPSNSAVLYCEKYLESDFVGLELGRCDAVTRGASKDGVNGQAIDILMVATKPD